jgi:hypothetical protein
MLVLGHLLFFASTVDSSGTHVLEVDFRPSQDFCVVAIFLLVQVAGKYLGNKFLQRVGLSILVKIGSHHQGNDSVIALNRKYLLQLCAFAQRTYNICVSVSETIKIIVKSGMGICAEWCQKDCIVVDFFTFYFT